MSKVKPRLHQCRAGIKWKTIRFPRSKPFDKSEQLKLLSGRRPIIQTAESSPLQQSHNINQSKTR